MKGIAAGGAADIAGQRPVGRPSLHRLVDEQSSHCAVRFAGRVLAGVRRALNEFENYLSLTTVEE